MQINNVITFGDHVGPDKAQRIIMQMEEDARKMRDRSNAVE